MLDNPPSKDQWQQLLPDEPDAAQRIWDLSVGYGEVREPVDVNAAWDRLAAQLPQATDAVESKATTHPKPRRLRWFAIGAVAAAILVVVLLKTLNFANESSQQYVNDANGPMAVTLLDASQVDLMPGAELNFTALDDSREATLKGTAHFAVEKDASRPFTIMTDEFQVLVIGTAFTVSTDATGRIQVTEGHVRVRMHSDDSWVDLYAGESVQISGGRILDTTIDGSSPLPLSFENVELQQVQRQLADSRVARLIINDKLAECTLTADFTGSSAQDIVDALAVLFQAEVRVRGDRFELIGGECR